jgi:hypothetical protein
MRGLALVVVVLALALAACESVGRSDLQVITPGEDVRMGTFTGTQVIDNPDGEHGTIQFVDGWKEGREQIYYADGTLEKDYTFHHGKPTGTCRSWHDNGKLEHESIIDESAETASYKW